MIGWLSTVVIGIAIVAAVWGLVTTIIGRPPGNLQFYWSFLVTLGVLAQSIAGFAAMATGNPPTEIATSIGYLIGIVVLMPAAILWALSDRSRYSGLVMMVAGVAIAVMSLRLLDLWGNLGG